MSSLLPPVVSLVAFPTVDLAVLALAVVAVAVGTLHQARRAAAVVTLGALRGRHVDQYHTGQRHQGQKEPHSADI